MRWIAVAIVLAALIGAGTAIAITRGPSHSKPCVDTITSGFGDNYYDSCDPARSP